MVDVVETYFYVQKCFWVKLDNYYKLSFFKFIDKCA